MTRFALRTAMSLPLLLLVGCAGGAVQSTVVGTPAAPTHTAQPVAAPTPHVFTTPPQFPQEAVKPDPNFDMGYAVQITDRGFQPLWLVSPCCEPITFHNMTGKPVSVVFDVLPVDSGVIAPGASWAYSPQNVESISYHSKTDPGMAANVQVNQVND